MASLLGEGDLETHGDITGHVKTRAETGVMQLLAKEAYLCWQLDFRLTASRSVRECIPVVFSHPVCDFVMAALGK